MNSPLTVEDEHMAPWSAADEQLCPAGIVPWATGKEAEPRPEPVGSQSGVGLMLVVLFLLVAFNLRNCMPFVKSFVVDLFTTRGREGGEGVKTTNELKTQAVMLVLLFFCEGVLAWDVLGVWTESSVEILLAAGAALAYFVFQRVGYWVTGYVFATQVQTSQWLRGFSASQCLLGLLLVLPALVSLFYPESVVAMAWVGVGLYVIARLAFVCKGVSLFYDGIGSVCYFILYLCTLEIAPVVLMAKSVGFLCKLQ